MRGRFAGIERADSMIVDPHKWLFAPYDCCALVYRDGALGRAAHTQHASYLDVIDREAPNPSDLAIHLSRRVRGLPFWFSLATHGTERYVEAVERTLRTAREVAAGIRQSRHLTLVHEPDLTVLLFERLGWDAERYQRVVTVPGAGGHHPLPPDAVPGPDRAAARLREPGDPRRRRARRARGHAGLIRRCRG